MSNLDEVLVEELKMLVRATRSERFRFIIIQFNHYGLIRKVESELKKIYPQRKFTNIKVEKDTADHFVTSIFEVQSGFVFVENFEKLFEEQYRPLALGLNQRRDKFANYPIILLAFLPWGNTYLQACQKAMPDMFSLVNPVIQLQEEIENVGLINSFIDSNGLYEASFSNISEAQKEVERLENRLESLDENPENIPLFFMLMNNLGMANKFLGNYEEAKAIYQIMLSILHKNPKGMGEQIGSVENNLATILQNLGDFEGAKRLLSKVIRSERKNGENYAISIARNSNLATTLKELGDYEGAKRILKKVVTTSEKHLGKDNPQTAIAYSNLAMVLRELGDYENAMKLLSKAVISDEKNFGENHPTTSNRYVNLAGVYQNLGNHEEARKLIEKAIISDMKNFGENHPTTALHYSNLATSLFYLNNINGAINLLEKAYKTFENNYEGKNRVVDIVKKNLDFMKQVNDLQNKILNQSKP